MDSIKIWCYTNGHNRKYVMSRPYPDIAEIGSILTHTVIDVITRKINANEWVYYVLKTDNDMYIKELEAAVNRRNKLNILMELKNV